MQQREHILNYFTIVSQAQSLGTSYLFIGGDESIIFDIAQMISCREQPFCGKCWDCRCIAQRSHPDLCCIEPDGVTIKIGAIREGIRFLSMKSYKLPRKILIIRQAHQLTLAAANAYLKTLEEPPGNSFIGISAPYVGDVLPTISSRCRKIFLPFTEHLHTRLKVDDIARFLEGGEVKFREREKFGSFLWTLIASLRDSLLRRIGFSNNQLRQSSDCEIILARYSSPQIEVLLEHVLKIYGAYKTVNMNLALHLIKVKL